MGRIRGLASGPRRPQGICGAPVNEYSSAQKTHIKCKRCNELKLKTKRCLRCDKEFTPGCRAPHTCHECSLRIKITPEYEP